MPKQAALDEPWPCASPELCSSCMGAMEGTIVSINILLHGSPWPQQHHSYKGFCNSVAHTVSPLWAHTLTTQHVKSYMTPTMFPTFHAPWPGLQRMRRPRPQQKQARSAGHLVGGQGPWVGVAAGAGLAAGPVSGAGGLPLAGGVPVGTAGLAGRPGSAAQQRERCRGVDL